jgi:hypothetical protein
MTKATRFDTSRQSKERATATVVHQTNRGRGTGFARPQAPDCETQPFCVPSKPALQAWSRGTQPPRGAGSYTQ